MNDIQVVPSRPATRSSESLKKPSSRDPAELNERLGRNRTIELVIDKMSGMGANTTEEFHDTWAIYKGFESLGMNVDAEIMIMREKARISGDEGGKNKLQIVQMLEEKPILLPGAASMYPQEPETPGLIARFFGMFSGKKAQAVNK